MRFSDRIGATEPAVLLQKDSMNAELRNLIWELLRTHVFLASMELGEEDAYIENYRYVIVYFMKLPMDAVYFGDQQKREFIRSWYYSAKWYEVYNLVEHICSNEEWEPLIVPLNAILKTERSAYRFTNGVLIPITDDIEQSAIATALNVGDRFAGARRHLANAIQLFSKKLLALFTDVVREAIMCAESVVKVISGKDNATLGEAIENMNKLKPMHPAFKDAFKKLYGYTSDEKGIRHALLNDEINVDEADAHFMIVVCSAFLNFAVQRSAQ